MLNLGCLVMVTGRITKDVEIRMAQGQSGEFATAKFTVAVNRTSTDKTKEQEADFIPCEVIGKTAEFVQKYFHKGSPIMLAGTILTYKRKEANGQYEKYANGWKIKADQVSFVPGAQRTQEHTETQVQQPTTNNNPFGGNSNFTNNNTAQTNQSFGFDPSFMGGNPNAQSNGGGFGFGFGNTGASGAPDFSTSFLNDDDMPFN